MNRPKLLFAAFLFLHAVKQICSHTKEYRQNMRPTGLRLVSATLSVISGILVLASELLDSKPADVSEVVAEDGQD